VRWIIVCRVNAPDLIPREVLFGNPERVSPQVSPDGTRMAWIAPHKGVLNVWVATIGGDDARPITDDRDRGIRAFFWVPDDLRIGYLQDRGGDENWRLYDVDLHTGESRDLTPFDGVQAQIIRVDLDIPDRILIGLNRDNEQLHDVYELRIQAGELTKVLQNPGLVGLVADGDLRVRAGVAPQPDGGRTVMIRDGGEPGSPWRQLLEVKHEDAEGTAPVSFSRDGTRLLLTSSLGANATQLIWMDLASGAAEVVASDPEYDVTAVLVNRRTRLPELVAFQRERLQWQALDPAAGADLAALEAYDAGDLHPLSRDRAEAAWIVAYDHADGPVRFCSFDRATRVTTFLFEDRPALARAGLAPMEPFAFTSRDGLRIHGYLTFPPGAPREGLPAVVNVHGGPWVRDTWGFDSEAQWLANRGYLCAQVNFRGSTGYGKSFTNAGDREWGARMHDDLVDAVRWLAANGHIDPGRVGIYGGSYGGYAALVGAAFTPDLFRCAVDIVGPSNLSTLIRSIPPYWEPVIAELHARVGNPDTEPDFLWSRSPLSRADAIRIPLLIAQGANDPRVKQAESEQIVAALRQKGLPHEYLLFPDEGHGLAKPENRLRFYAAAERFLAAHLGGRFEP
jgi:dipeptidyl aminopeptidase/acylaminoacyl peptidase